ncbi:MAG: DPP IV N-terminal domain-containing protein [Balneolaceae bacterium]|nr:DPP IV N-terminal domain-containing protein [Balneolaceae bacterium]
MNTFLRSAIKGALVFLLMNSGSLVFAQFQNSSSLEDYQRAQYFLSSTLSPVYEAFVSPNWTSDGEAFWYEKKGVKLTEYFLVEPQNKSKKPLFDRGKLAQKLQELSSDSINIYQLPIRNLSYDDEIGSLQFRYGNNLYAYDITNNHLEALPEPYAPLPTESLSPDGSLVAYVKDYNLYIREVDNKEEIQLTFDGEKHFAYATTTETNLSYVTSIRNNWPVPPVLAWSKDSKKILTHQLDERKVESTHLLQMVDTDESLRPMLYTYKYPVPGDSIIPLAYPVVIDIEQKKITKLDIPPLNSISASPLEAWNKRIWWHSSGEFIEALWQDRFYNEIEYYLINPDDGSADLLVSETSKSLISPNLNIFSNPNVKYLVSGEFIWFSEKSGYGHLYFYGKDKQLKNSITSGEFVVREILFVDEVNRQIFFTATGKEDNIDPYFLQFYKADFEGKNLELLTPDKADHKIKLSPNQKYFISNNAWNGLPVSVLRDIDGNHIMDLENSDFSAWTDKGWRWPERVEMLSNDGETSIYGVVFKPSNLNTNAKYPVLDDMYPGPQINRNYHIGFDGPISSLIRHQSAIAELGFVVANIDGRGTPFRSKEFLNHSYNDLGSAGGLDDHVSGIIQLSDKYSYIDTSRVGAFGHSGGGYASTRAILEFTEFYDVAVSSAGNHDSRGYTSIWMDSYMGKADSIAWKDQSNASLAQNLKGKLLLMTGDLDDNVHPSMTINLVDELIKANKDFDFLLIPNANHGSSSNPYFFRKRWDYFYRHLLGKEPPMNFKLSF